jgi:hypothetical protein
VPYTLIDSRPLLRFQEGAIPTAPSTCPSSASTSSWTGCPRTRPAGGLLLRRHHLHAEPELDAQGHKMGYTSCACTARVSPNGRHATTWSPRPAFVKAAYIDRDIPHVMIDARATEDATSGHIKGAVSMPAAEKAGKAQAQAAAPGARRRR